MKTIALFGASGRTGQPLLEKALQAGYRVKALVRDPAKLNAQHPNLAVVRGDVLDEKRVEDLIQGTDAVLSVIGRTQGSPPDLQTTATRYILAAMQKHGVRRIISLTGGGVRDANDRPKLIDHFIVFAMKNLAGQQARLTLADAEAHAGLIRSSGLDWTLVRGPRLTEEPAKGNYRVGYVGVGTGINLTRADLADFILRQIDDPTHRHKAPFLSN